MDRKDIENRIAKAKKDKEEFNESLLAELGFMMKGLPKDERDWDWLAVEVGWKGTGNALWHSINGYLSLAEKASSAGKEFERLEKAKQKLRDARNDYARMLREDARIEALKESFVSAVRGLPSLPKLQPATKRKGNVEAVALFSDLHVGVEIDDYCNRYNSGIAAERVSRWVDSVKAYCKKFGVRRLDVLSLGDAIAGIIHVTIRLQQQFDVITQVMVAGELLAQALNRLQGAAPEVVYRSCTDNHSRVVADKSQAIEKENLGRLIDWFIEERLKGSRIKFAKDNLSSDLGKFRLLNGKVAMFSHGHLDMKNQVFQNYVGATREFVDYIFLGHYHSPETKSFQNCRVFINGSIVGPDQYARDRRLFSDPSQKLVLFDEDNVIDIDISLAGKKAPKEDKNG